MKNRELQKKLAEYPDWAEIELLDTATGLSFPLDEVSYMRTKEEDQPLFLEYDSSEQ